MKTIDPHAIATALETAAAKLRSADSPINWTAVIQTLLPLLLQLLEQWLTPQPAPQSHADAEDAQELD